MLWSPTAGNAAESRAVRIQRLQEQVELLWRPLVLMGANGGIQVVSLDSGETVIEHQADKLFTPASNTKLFVAAMALEKLGGAASLRTSIYGNGNLDRRGKWTGDLVLYGRGDPAWVQGVPTTPAQHSIRDLVNAVIARGVRSIRGDLLADESFFVGPSFGSGWTAEDLDQAYAPEVSSLSINGNVVEWTAEPSRTPGAPALLRFLKPDTEIQFYNRLLTTPAGNPPGLQWQRRLGQPVLEVWGGIPIGTGIRTNSVTLPRPALAFAKAFAQTLTQMGVKWEGSLRNVRWIDRWRDPLDSRRWQEIASVPSAPVRELVKAMIKPSDNLAAELLFLQLGAQAEVDPVALSTTEEKAAKSMRAFLRPIVTGSVQPSIEEGSGMSRRNAVTPRNLVDLLRWMQRRPSFEAFREALPVAGVDGTLQTRFRGTAAEGNLRAKTGSLKGVQTLSGYLTTRNGEHWAFSILLNQCLEGPASTGRDAIDRMATLLADFGN